MFEVFHLIFHPSGRYINRVVAPEKRPLLVNCPIRQVRIEIEKITALQVGVEVYIDNNLLEEITKDEVKEVGRLLRERGLACTLHAPYMDLSPGGFDNKIRTESRDKLKRAVEKARVLEAMAVVCHSGYDRWRFGDNEQPWFDASVETWSQVLAEAGGDLPVLLENVFEETPSTLITLFDYFRGKNLHFCFDTGHFNLFTKVSLDAWLVPLKERLREFHLHDNNGKADDHLPIGSGTFPFRELKAFLRQSPDLLYTVEPHTYATAADSIRRAKEFMA